MKMNSKTLFSLLATYYKFSGFTSDAVPWVPEVFLRSFRCRSFLYCDPSEKPQGPVVRKPVNLILG